MPKFSVLTSHHAILCECSRPVEAASQDSTAEDPHVTILPGSVLCIGYDPSTSVISDLSHGNRTVVLALIQLSGVDIALSARQGGFEGHVTNQMLIQVVTLEYLW